MEKEAPLWLVIVSFLLIVSISGSSLSGSGQVMPGNSKMISGSGNVVVSVNTSLKVPVSNDSLKNTEGMLRSSVVNFLNSGPNVLKSQDSSQPDVKTKIMNSINNDTQDVQGIEATNAIIAVEFGKALRTLVSSSSSPNQTAIVTISTTSTCKPSTTKILYCENTVSIK